MTMDNGTGSTEFGHNPEDLRKIDQLEKQMGELLLRLDGVSEDRSRHIDKSNALRRQIDAMEVKMSRDCVQISDLQEDLDRVRAERDWAWSEMFRLKEELGRTDSPEEERGTDPWDILEGLIRQSEETAKGLRILSEMLGNPPLQGVKMSGSD